MPKWAVDRWTFVSILDLLEVGFRQDFDVNLDWLDFEFQSLICWKSDSDPLFGIGSEIHHFRFNP